MINTELIARAICHHGKCTSCDAECLNYREAQRVMRAIEAEPPVELLKTAEKFVSKAGLELLHGELMGKALLVQELTAADLGLLKTINKLEEVSKDGN